MKYYQISEFTKLIGRTPQTLRNWDKDNVLKPHEVLQSWYRCYLHDQVELDD